MIFTDLLFLEKVRQKQKFRKKKFAAILFHLLITPEGTLTEEKRGNALRNVPTNVYSK